MSSCNNDNNISHKRRKQRDKDAFIARKRSIKVIAMQTQMKDNLPFRKKEIEYIQNKYFLANSQVKPLSIYYFNNVYVDNDTLVNVANLIEKVLKYIFEYTEEEIIRFFQRNLMILKSSYSDIVYKLSIFNHFDLLEEALFKGISYLNFYSRCDKKTLYSLLSSTTINSIEELNELIERLPDKKILDLIKNNSLTNEILKDFENEFRKRIEKGAFRYQLKCRKLSKEMK